MSVAPPARSADPSAALVQRIADEAMSPAYAARAGSHERSRHQRRPPAGSAVLTLLTVALAGLLVGVLVVAAQARAEQVDSERSNLVGLAQSSGEDVELLRDQAAALEAEVTELREAALGSASVGAERAEQIARSGLAAGTTPVTGPGARLVVADGEQPTSGTDPGLSRVLDLDLQRIVNGLWEVGAEAVAINGERVGALSSIRSRAEVILVNYAPVVSPYEVEAIGDPLTLPADFLRSSGGEWLQLVATSAGVRLVSLDPVTEDMLLAGEPVGELRHARPVPTASEETS